MVMETFPVFPVMESLRCKMCIRDSILLFFTGGGYNRIIKNLRRQIMRKKFLAVLLSAAMVSGSFAPVYGADFSDGGAAVTEALPEEMTEETAEETPVEAATEEEIFSDQSADTEEFVTEEAPEEEIQEGFEAEGTEEETDSQEDVAFTEEESAILEEPEVQEETEQLFADEDAAEAAGAEEAGSEVSSLWISGILYNKVYRVSMYPTRDEVYDDGNGLLCGLSIGLTQADGKQESRWFGDYNPIKKGEEQCYVCLLYTSVPRSVRFSSYNKEYRPCRQILHPGRLPFLCGSAEACGRGLS